MEVDFSTAQKVEIKRVKDKTFYLPLYTSDKRFWCSGCLAESEQEALDSVKYYGDVQTIRVFKITLPIASVPDEIEIV